MRDKQKHARQTKPVKSTIDDGFQSNMNMRTPYCLDDSIATKGSNMCWERKETTKRQQQDRIRWNEPDAGRTRPAHEARGTTQNRKQNKKASKPPKRRVDSKAKGPHWLTGSKIVCPACALKLVLLMPYRCLIVYGVV